MSDVGTVTGPVPRSDAGRSLFSVVRQKIADAETALLIVEPRPAYAQIALDAVQDAEAALTAAEGSGECHGNCGAEYLNFGCPRCRATGWIAE